MQEPPQLEFYNPGYKNSAEGHYDRTKISSVLSSAGNLQSCSGMFSLPEEC